jgi:Protein of unknown function (DUF4012)
MPPTGHALYHRPTIMRPDRAVNPPPHGGLNVSVAHPMYAAGSASGRPKRRTRALLALAVIALILAGLGGGSDLAYASVRFQATALETQLTTHLELGQAELEAAKANLKQANANLDQGMISQAKVHFITAKLQFMATRQIADNSELLGRLERVPAVGRLARSRHTAVNDVAEMGIQLALAGQDLADLDGVFIKPTTSGQQSGGLLTLLGQVQNKLGPLRTELSAAQKAADRVDVGVLPSGQQATFLRARGTIGQALAAIDQFGTVIPILNEVLGGNGVRNYLIEQVNPAELRAGGGFIGTYSVLRADHGSLTLVKSGDATELILPRATVGHSGYVAPPGPLRESLLTNTSWSFIDSNFYPDFPSNAQAAESFAQPHLGFHIDGVLSIDYYTVAKLLALTGPIGVPGYGITLTADTLVPLIVQYDLAAFTDPHANVVHKAILAAVAGPLLQRIATLPSGYWPALVGALNALAASRNLQAYFNNGDVEKAIGQYGWSGVQKTTGASDYMMEVESNFGATKANYFVARHYTVELTRSGGTLHHKVTVDIYDNMPYSYRPYEYYQAYIRLYVSDKATSTSNNLVPPRYANPPPPAGTRMLDGWMNIHGYGHDKSVVFEWDTPWQANGRGQEQIYWQKQPGTTNDKVDVIWNDGNGHTYKVSGDLGQDRVITLAPTAVSLLQGQIGTAQLPTLSLG